MTSQFDTDTQIANLKKQIREVPDFPKQGILFYDLTTLFREAAGLRSVIEFLTERYKDKGIDRVIGIESRGFIFGPTVAYNIGAGFVPVRKPGKLPAPTFRETYQLEYGTDCLEIHQDAIQPGQKVLIVDDLIATGGTAAATVNMVRKMSAELVGLAFVVELEALKGREKLDSCEVFSILKY